MLSTNRAECVSFPEALCCCSDRVITDTPYESEQSSKTVVNNGAALSEKYG